jgi:phosphoglycolate phosphatase
MTETTTLFPGMEKVLQHLDNNQISWGIVTNKPSRFTVDLLDVLDLTRRTNCIICGDTLAKRKPHPEPILEACKILNQNPENTIYVGDTLTDVTASKAAGTRSLVVLYGYIGPEENPYNWQADAYVKTADEIINWI